MLQTPASQMLYVLTETQKSHVRTCSGRGCLRAPQLMTTCCMSASRKHAHVPPASDMQTLHVSVCANHNAFITAHLSCRDGSTEGPAICPTAPHFAADASASVSARRPSPKASAILDVHLARPYTPARVWSRRATCKVDVAVKLLPASGHCQVSCRSLQPSRSRFQRFGFRVCCQIMQVSSGCVTPFAT